MQTDDPRLEQSRKQMEERLQSFNALMLNVIKGHILVEQALDSFLEATLSHPEHVQDGRYARFTHSQKIQMCRAASFNKENEGYWQVIWAINTLRNRMAHGSNDEEIKKKMSALRKEFLGILTEEQAAGIKDKPDEFIAESACVTCAGFLWAIQGDARGRQDTIETHWKPQ